MILWISVWAPPLWAESTQALVIGVAVPLTGNGKHLGPEIVNAVHMAIDQANAATGGIDRKIEMRLYDDATSAETVVTVARQVGTDHVMAVIGHPHSAVSLAAVPIYQQAGIALLSTAAEDTLSTNNQVFFRIIPALDAQGRSGAIYAHEALGLDKATIVYRDDNFGRSLTQAFGNEFTGLNMGKVRTVAIAKGPVNWAEIVDKVAEDPSPGLIVMAMQDYEASQFLVEVRRHHLQAAIMGSQAVARDIFISLFKDHPEEQTDPGHFAEGVYALAPAILDTANKDTLDFAQAYRARFGDYPGWIGIKYYEAARTVIKALALSHPDNRPDHLAADRKAVRDALAAMTTKQNAAEGLTGPILFDAQRNRVDSVRVGQFQSGRFISAPLQFVPVVNPERMDLKSALAADKIRKVGSDYFWRQRIVYTGLRPISIDKIETKESMFAADFYMWMRFVDRDGVANVEFPDMLRGTFDPKRPVTERKSGGMTYLLYRVKGDFRNEYNLADYPFDRQDLTIRMANYRLPREEVVYVEDQLTSPGSESAAWRTPGQWQARDVQSYRDEIVSKEALGDPDAIQTARALEFSGFKAVVTVQRQVLVFLKKNLLALALLTMVIYSTLFYPDSLLKERLTVPVAGILSASVLLAAVQNKLGDIGSTTMAEMIFYIFYFITLLAMLSALAEERLRSAGWPRLSQVVRQASFVLYPLTVLGAVLVLLVKYADRF